MSLLSLFRSGDIGIEMREDDEIFGGQAFILRETLTDQSEKFRLAQSAENLPMIVCSAHAKITFVSFETCSINCVVRGTSFHQNG